MGFFEREMRLIEKYGRRGWDAVQNSALVNIIRKDKGRDLGPDEKAGLARHWGRLSFQNVVRYVPKAPCFVHCYECRWPVNPGRTHMLLGNDQRVEASEGEMQRVCEGVRRHMEVA